MITAIAIAIVVVLAVSTMFSFVHASSSKLSAEETRASNARVLREYRRMTVHSPEKIIDYRQERSGRAQHTHDA